MPFSSRSTVVGRLQARQPKPVRIKKARPWLGFFSELVVPLFSTKAEKILEDLCRVAMTREDTAQMDLELARMEGPTVTSTPAHRPLPAEEGKFQ